MLLGGGRPQSSHRKANPVLCQGDDIHIAFHHQETGDIAQRLTGFIFKFIRLLLGTGLLLSVLLICANAFGRYVLHAPIIWAEEVLGFVLVWVVYLGAVEVTRDGGHLSMDLITQSLNPRWRRLVELLRNLVFLAVPLSRMSPRKGRYGGLVLPVLVFIIYFNLMGTAKAWVEQGAIPPAIGIWWVHLLPVALAVVLLNSDRLGCFLKRRP